MPRRISNKLNGEIARNLLWRAAQILFKQGFILFLFLITAKELPVYQFGVYNYLLTLILLVGIFSDFGISTATSKFTTEYSIKDRSAVGVIVGNSLLLISALGALAACLLAIFSRFFMPSYFEYLLVVLPIIVFSPISSLFDGVYRGLKLFKKLAVMSVVAGILSFGAALFLIGRFGLMGALVSQDVFYLLLSALLFVQAPRLSFALNKRLMLEITRYSLMVGMASLGFFLYSKIVTLLWGYYGYLDQVAVFELINKFSNLALTPFYIIGQVIAPHFTEHHVSGRYREIRQALMKSSILYLAVAIGISALLYFAAPYAIHLFFPKYDTPLFGAILLPSLLILGINITSATIDTGMVVPTGYAHFMAYLYLVFGALNVAASLIAIRWFGYLSVIYLNVITSLILLGVIRVLYFRKVQRLLTDQAALRR